jgi:hypothetical protein
MDMEKFDFDLDLDIQFESFKIKIAKYINSLNQRLKEKDLMILLLEENLRASEEMFKKVNNDFAKTLDQLKCVKSENEKLRAEVLSTSKHQNEQLTIEPLKMDNAVRISSEDSSLVNKNLAEIFEAITTSIRNGYFDIAYKGFKIINNKYIKNNNLNDQHWKTYYSLLTSYINNGARMNANIDFVFDAVKRLEGYDSTQQLNSLLKAVGEILDKHLETLIKNISIYNALILLRAYFKQLYDLDASNLLTAIINSILRIRIADLTQSEMMEVLYISIYFEENTVVETIIGYGPLLSMSRTDVNYYKLYKRTMNRQITPSEFFAAAEKMETLITTIDIRILDRVISCIKGRVSAKQDEMDAKLIKEQLKQSKDESLKTGIPGSIVKEVILVDSEEIKCPFCKMRFESRFVDIAYYHPTDTKRVRGHKRAPLLYCSTCKNHFGRNDELNNMSFEIGDHIFNLTYWKEIQSINTGKKTQKQAKEITNNKLAILDLGKGLTLSDESRLHSLGYQLTGLTRSQRWGVLVNMAIPKLGVDETIRTIQSLVNLRKNQKNGAKRYSNAIREWEWDIKQLQELRKTK